MEPISLSWLIAATFVSLGAVAAAVVSAPWRVVLRERPIQHLLLGVIVSLPCLWSLRAGLSPGLSIHFLGMTTLTLVLGWDLALIAGAVALTGLTALGGEVLPMLPFNLLCLVVVPVGISAAVLRLVERRLPKNFFVYLLLCAFAGGGLAAVGGGLALAGFLGLAGVHPWEVIRKEYLQYVPLILFPEGLINGFLMTGMMVYHPDWMRTFDTGKYLDGQ